MSARIGLAGVDLVSRIGPSARALGCQHAALACAAAKAYAGDASRLVCGETIQMHGSIGFTWD
jgi:alkylation response protein AidB-like acyl-CoA dehydrogenase